MSGRPRLNRRLNRKGAGLVAAGALTATTAIATTVVATDGDAPKRDQTGPVAAGVGPTDGLQAELQSERDAARAGRGADRPAITPTSTPTPSKRPAAHKAKPKRTTNAERHARRINRQAHGASCGASFYDEGQQTASGEPFNPNALTAAHRTLPLGSHVLVTNARTGRSVVVRINDRGPYAGGRCLDLSRAAFGRIASLSAGVVRVRYEVL